MIVSNNKIRFGVTDIVSLIISVLFLIGIRVWFPVCEPMEDSLMACYWAGKMLKAVSVLLIILSAVHLIISDVRIKIGMDIALNGIYALTFCVPGKIINLCKMSEMHCRHNTQPWTIVFMIVLIIACVADIIFYMSQNSKEKHSRKSRDEGDKA